MGGRAPAKTSAPRPWHTDGKLSQIVFDDVLDAHLGGPWVAKAKATPSWCVASSYDDLALILMTACCVGRDVPTPRLNDSWLWVDVEVN
eukprot:1158157-Pelagomonas_calceolata.AAC.5